MSSITSQPFYSIIDTQFREQLHDHYPLDNITLKVKSALRSGIGGVAAYRTNYNTKLRRFEQEAKVQFPWDRYTFLIGSRGAEEFKFHIDFGQFEFSQYKPSFYTNAKFDSQKLQSLRLGVILANSKLYNNLRLIHSGRHIHLDNKLHIRNGNWEYCDVSRYPINNQLDVFRWDSQVLFKSGDYQYYFKHVSSNNVDSTYGNYSLNHGYFGLGFLANLPKVLMGIESYYKDQKVMTSIAAETNIIKYLFLKAKLNNTLTEEIAQLQDLSLTLALRFIKDEISLTLAAHIPIVTPNKESPVKKETFLKYPWGIKLDVNL